MLHNRGQMRRHATVLYGQRFSQQSFCKKLCSFVCGVRRLLAVTVSFSLSEITDNKIE